LASPAPSPTKEPVKEPVTPAVTIREPVISEFVFTLNLLSAIEAVKEPDAIRDKFSPVIPEAGILNKLAPEPDNIPVLETANNVVPPDSKINELAPVETEAVTIPVLILSNVKSPAVVIG
jgi:hypothetical protein